MRLVYCVLKAVRKVTHESGMNVAQVLPEKLATMSAVVYSEPKIGRRSAAAIFGTPCMR